MEKVPTLSPTSLLSTLLLLAALYSWWRWSHRGLLLTLLVLRPVVVLIEPHHWRRSSSPRHASPPEPSPIPGPALGGGLEPLSVLRAGLDDERSEDCEEPQHRGEVHLLARSERSREAATDGVTSSMTCLYLKCLLFIQVMSLST